MLEVQLVCDRVLFLSHGKVLLEGDPRSLPRLHGAAGLEELFIRVAREPLVHASPSMPASDAAQ
jgi:ABC-2 type transport system ATP-binding protein